MAAAHCSGRGGSPGPAGGSGLADESDPAGPGRAAAGIERAIRAAGTPDRATGARAYLKSDLDFAGTTVPAVRALLRSWRQGRPGLTRAELTAIVTALWSGQLFENRLAGVLLLAGDVQLLAEQDAALVERLLRAAGTWALVDGLAADVMGPLVERFPGLATTLDRWAADDDFWIRRSALLALLVPLRRGDGDFERFARYADQMLGEREFFIRKAIGWVLRETARRRPGLVAEWLAPRVHRASGVTLREAVKPLLPADRERLMAAYRQSGTGRGAAPASP